MSIRRFVFPQKNNTAFSPVTMDLESLLVHPDSVDTRAILNVIDEIKQSCVEYYPQRTTILALEQQCELIFDAIIALRPFLNKEKNDEFDYFSKQIKHPVLNSYYLALSASSPSSDEDKEITHNLEYWKHRRYTRYAAVKDAVTAIDLIKEHIPTEFINFIYSLKRTHRPERDAHYLLESSAALVFHLTKEGLHASARFLLNIIERLFLYCYESYESQKIKEIHKETRSFSEREVYKPTKASVPHYQKWYQTDLPKKTPLMNEIVQTLPTEQQKVASDYPLSRAAKRALQRVLNNLDMMADLYGHYGRYLAIDLSVNIQFTLRACRRPQEMAQLILQYSRNWGQSMQRYRPNPSEIYEETQELLASLVFRLKEEEQYVA